MTPKIDIQAFVDGWVAENVRGSRNHSNTPGEVNRLAANITADAREQGISGSDIYRTVGDLDDYLTELCERNPESSTSS